MTLQEAIQNRHSIRRYKETPLPADAVAQLQQTIDRINAESKLHIQFVTNEPKGFNSLLNYGLFSGVSNYFVIAGKKSDTLDETAGYYGEQLVLTAQQMGLNTCWAGLTYKKVAGTYKLEDDEKIVCYIAVGYGAEEGRALKRKTIKQLSNASEKTPEWFARGVEAARLAPTAVNQQKFHFEYTGKTINNRTVVKASKKFSLFNYTEVDLGIAKLHFEIGAGKENFEWDKQ